MAGLSAINAVGSSLVGHFRAAYPETLATTTPCDFRLVVGAEFDDLVEAPTTVSVLLYRVTANEHLRSGLAPGAPGDARPPLSVNLHYLVTVWAAGAEAEQLLAAWVLRELHARPLLDAPVLEPAGGFEPGDVVHLIPEELTTEDLMRIWDALTPAYRLSFCYVARVVRIDLEDQPSGLPVVAERRRVGVGAEVEGDG